MRPARAPQTGGGRRSHRRLLELTEELLAHGGTARASAIHGEGHWRRVAATGLRLLAATPAADGELVLLFALLHDARRENDGRDPDHGPRAALLARELNADLLGLSPERLALLERALGEHTFSGPTGEPTVGVCFDADRLNLWRVGIVPHPRFLSTSLAQDHRTIAWAQRLQGTAPAWPEVLTGYAERLSTLPRRLVNGRRASAVPTDRTESR